MHRNQANGRRGGRYAALRAVTVLAAACCILFGTSCARQNPDDGVVLRIYDWKTGEVYAEAPARPGSRLFFGWMHSQENIPWNEYYHVAPSLALILDVITFPAFGAGIPEDKGRVCYVKDGLIHMEGIDQMFPELVWLNSHTATRDIMLDDKHVTSGGELPQHTRLRLVIEKR